MDGANGPRSRGDRTDRSDRADGSGAAPRPRALETRATADGSLTLFDPEADQTFHSAHGAVAEARHVYLGASGAGDRLARGDETRVVEIGLGAGLNLLLTADAALASGATLRYRAVERRPAPVRSVRALDLGRHLSHPELAEAWLGVLAMLEDHASAQAVEAGRVADRGLGRAEDGVPRSAKDRGPGDDEGRGPGDAEHGGPGDAEDRTPDRADDRARGSAADRVVAVTEGALAPGVTLEVALGDAAGGAGGTPGKAAAAMLEPGWAHAIYHDAFSPSASPELWSDAFLGACARALAPGGAWTSYSVAGAVRRRLTEHGLVVSKLHGPEGGKREMTRALRSKGSANDPTASPRR